MYVALSSGEAEYTAAVKGCSQALGSKALMKDLGIHDPRIDCYCGSNAAVVIASRTGAGSICHLAVHLLWLQEKIRCKETCINKVDGIKNMADLFTKYLDSTALERYSRELGLVAERGRASAAPTLQEGFVTVRVLV